MTQYGGYALHAGFSWLYARMRMHTPTRPGTHMHAQIKCIILTAFPQQQRFCERALMLRYTYISCLLNTDLLDRVQ